MQISHCVLRKGGGGVGEEQQEQQERAGLFAGGGGAAWQSYAPDYQTNGQAAQWAQVISYQSLFIS